MEYYILSVPIFFNIITTIHTYIKGRVIDPNRNSTELFSSPNLFRNWGSSSQRQFNHLFLSNFDSINLSAKKHFSFWQLKNTEAQSIACCSWSSGTLLSASLKYVFSLRFSQQNHSSINDFFKKLKNQILPQLLPF